MAAEAAVADTHVLVWSVAGQPLSQPALVALDGATAASEPIHVSAITLLEDPQLHAHVLVANRVRCADGAWQFPLASRRTAQDLACCGR